MMFHSPTTLAHISDLHFGRLDDPVAEALLEDLHQSDPDLIVVSGDVTQHASHREYREVRDYLKRFPTPPLIVPGNHDLPGWNLPERFLAPTARFRHYIEDDPFPYRESGNIAVLGVDTTRPHGWYFDWSRGRMSLQQIRKIYHTFQNRSSDRLNVVVTHHPFLHPPDGEFRHIVKGPGDILRTLADGGVDLLLAGHFHKAYSDLAVGRHPEARDLVVAQTSTTTSVRLRDEPNSYNWFEYEDGRLRVTIQAWTRDGFRPTLEKRYHKGNGRWVRDKVDLFV